MAPMSMLVVWFHLLLGLLALPKPLPTSARGIWLALQSESGLASQSDSSDSGSSLDFGSDSGSGSGSNSDAGRNREDNDIDALLAAAAQEFANDPLFAEAQVLADPTFGPVPGQTALFSSYSGIDAPWPGNITHPILPTRRGPPGVDDRTWQNLLSAEWVIFAFYQLAATTFNPTSFTAVGLPSTTYDRILEIRNNEAGHLRLFQNQISPTSIKPGSCRYAFPITADEPLAFLALLTLLEISSMAFLTGLVQQPQNPAGRGAMTAIAQTETRHEVWALMGVWKANPFAGPSDTMFPYADEILDTTNAFIVPGSCPGINPTYPTPQRGLPELKAGEGTVSLAPGSRIRLYIGSTAGEGARQPIFEAGRQYYAVFFHGMGNVSVPIETRGWPAEDIWVTIPAQFETKGVVVAVVADESGAPTKESLVAGPGIILEQPEEVAAALVKGASGGPA